MTVEAALLLPLLLGVMILLIYVSVFLYNRCAASALAGTAAVMAAGMEHESPAQIKKDLDRYLEEGKTHLPMAKEAACEVSVSLLQVKVRVKFRQKVEAMLLPLANREAEYTAKETVQRLDPAKYLRTIKIANKARDQSSRPQAGKQSDEG
ncbi:MAG: hypothetical protein K6E18_02370 [Lachnospiraceae bacterium]|nr:hypothetical protein [Lachnospiraceae bacterium]